MSKSNAEKEAKLRKRLSESDINPIMDFILTIVSLAISPIMWLWGLFHDYIMFKFLNKTYIYNVSWEDPRMDHRVFRLNESDHVITIASAGCNVLDYVIEGAEVTAVDFNSCQIALTELKVVAIIHLTFEQFFEIFSKSNMKVLQAVYPKLKPHLTKPSADYWDTNIFSTKSFMYSGTSGSCAYFLFRVLFPLFGLGFIRRALIDGVSREELQKLIVNHGRGIRALAWIADNIFLRVGCCMAGVPQRQMELGMHRPNNIGQVIEKIFFKTDLVYDNYFFSGYFLGYYKPDNCPRYLRAENFEKMKRHLQNGKLHLIHGTILGAINDINRAKNPITVASLLDHMDWMTDTQINEEITHLLKKMDTKRGKIYWRTYADGVHSAPLFWLNADRVDDHDDRVCMYWNTYIAYLSNLTVDNVERQYVPQSKGLVQDFVTGVKMVTFPVWKHIVSSSLKVTGHAKKMESFYKYQNEDYDSFRENLLHARSALMESIPLKKDGLGKMVWVDIGGGTARNLEFFSIDTLRKYFSRIFIVDISPSLLEIAQKRVNKLGLNDIVTIIEHDCTLESVFQKFPKGLPGTVDLVTMSYSFSMIPDQVASVNNVCNLLKSGGLFAIADFFLNFTHDDILPMSIKCARKVEVWFHKWWFAHDNVHLLSDNHLSDIFSSKPLKVVWDRRNRGTVPFIPLLKPFHGVYILKKD